MNKTYEIINIKLKNEVDLVETSPAKIKNVINDFTIKVKMKTYYRDEYILIGNEALNKILQKIPEHFMLNNLNINFDIKNSKGSSR